MPYKCETDHYIIAGTPNDRRIKLTEVDKKQIKQLYKNGMAIRAIGRAYSVDKRLIQFILFPERLTENKKRREERGGWIQYYNKESNTVSIRKTRQHKHEVYTQTKQKGEITNDKIKHN